MSDQIKELLNQAIFAVRNKDFQKGVQLCNKAIGLNPAMGDAYNILGLIHSERKEFSKGIAFIRKALLCSPNQVVYLNNLGKLLMSSGKDKEAVSLFEKIIKIQPEFFQAYFSLGKHYKKNDQVEKAKSFFEKTISLKPDFVPALNNLANLLQKENNHQGAFDLYQQALAINPAFPEIHANLGHIHVFKGELKLAEDAFLHSIQMNPNYWDAHFALANLYNRGKQFIDAERSYLNVLKINPSHQESLIALGDIYRRNGDLEKAIRIFLNLISIEPENKIAHINAGVVYFLISDHENARKHFLKVLEIDPLNAESKFTLGKLSELDKDYIKAKQLYEEVLKDEHAFNIQVLYELVLLNLRIADWSRYDELLARLIQETKEYLAEASNFNVTPLTLNYFPIPHELHLGVSKRYSELVSEEIRHTKKACEFSYPKTLHEGKLRIAYISPDFRLHAVGLLLKDLFRHHDRNRVEVYLYSIVNTDDEYNTSFIDSSDVFRDISRLSHLEASTLINKDQIHVLIDLAGYTTYSRPHILAYQPAPLQMSFLGYPNTSGSSYMNYILGDKWLLPDHLKPYYSEEFVHLPHAFVSSSLEVASNCPTRAELGLPDEAFVYCCFNSIYKISPQVFSAWMKILKATPKAVLWLSKENDLAVDNLKKEALKHGVNESRLVFAERLPMDEYLASYQYADVFLDTFYYSAGSTAVCALYAGVPLLTLAGESNASRMGASIVDAVGQGTFIVNTEEAYMAKAIDMYHHGEEGQRAKEYLRIRKNELSLFDLKGFASALETKLLKIFEKCNL